MKNSCSSEESVSIVNETLPEPVDTVSEEVVEEIIINDHLQAILDLSTTEYELPVNIDTNYEVVNTLLLAEISEGDDLPSWSDTHISSELTEGLIKTIK